jgi:spore maturation protein SpmB
MGLTMSAVVKKLDNASENPTSAALEAVKKLGAIESFMNGCKKGVHITLDNIMPAMVLGYALIQFLTLTGLIEILARVCGPVMGIFGLPGDAVAVFIAAIFAKASGAAAAASLHNSGVLTAAQATLCVVPSMLMGTLIGHYARNVLVSGVENKRRALLLILPIIDTIIGLFIMRGLLVAMGLWS